MTMKIWLCGSKWGVLDRWNFPGSPMRAWEPTASCRLRSNVPGRMVEISPFGGRIVSPEAYLKSPKVPQRKVEAPILVEKEMRSSFFCWKTLDLRERHQSNVYSCFSWLLQKLWKLPEISLKSSSYLFAFLQLKTGPICWMFLSGWDDRRRISQFTWESTDPTSEQQAIKGAKKFQDTIDENVAGRKRLFITGGNFRSNIFVEHLSVDGKVFFRNCQKSSFSEARKVSLWQRWRLWKRAALR